MIHLYLKRNAIVNFLRKTNAVIRDIQSALKTI